MTTQTKMYVSLIAVAVSGFAVYRYLPGLGASFWDTTKAIITLLALLVSIIFYLKFLAANAAGEKNQSEEDILVQERLKLKGKGIK